MVALNTIVIICLNSYWISGEEVKGNDEEIKGSKVEIEGSKDEIKRSEEDSVLMELIPDFYKNYRDVLNNANETKSLRRIFKNDREFQIHVEKLKEVNGFKKHNLILRESNRDNPIIYINNPVETKIPNAYLSLENFKKMLTERISKQKEQFKKDYIKPKRHRKEPVSGVEINMDMMIGKPKKKLTTIFGTDKFQTESNKNKSNLTPISIVKENTTQYIAHVSKVRHKSMITPNGTMYTYNLKAATPVFVKKVRLNDAHGVTFARSTTQAVYSKKINEGKKINTQKDTTFLLRNSSNAEVSITSVTRHKKVKITKSQEKEQIISKIFKIKPSIDEIVKKSLENMTENSVNSTTTEVVKKTQSYSKENKENITEKVETNHKEDKIVRYTPENVTEDSLGTTTEYKNILTTDLEANEQKISTLEDINPSKDVVEENTPAGTTEDTPEVATEQIEEDTTSSREVTVETTSTTVKPKRTRLSRPLVFLGDK